MDLKKLSNIAIEAALSAGKVIQQYMNKDISVNKKKTGGSYASQVVTAADLASETEILIHLKPTCKKYDIALLSEETEDDGGRFKKKYFWCIDPMDGTLAFIKKQAGFSISIALVSNDGTPQIGVVFDPSTNTLYHATKGSGAFKNREPWEIINKNKHLSYITDRRLKDTPRADEIKNLLRHKTSEHNLKGIEEIAGAGAVLNAILVLEYGPACMLKFPKKEYGGGCIWDYAATACIYKELDLIATNFNGGRLGLNKEGNSYMNHEGIYFSNIISK